MSSPTTTLNTNTTNSTTTNTNTPSSNAYKSTSWLLSTIEELALLSSWNNLQSKLAVYFVVLYLYIIKFYNNRNF